MMRDMFDEQDAIKYGVQSAVLLHNLRLFCEHSKVNKENLYKCADGKIRAWTSYSITGLTNFFPYWSNDQIHNSMRKLLRANVVEKDNFNEDPHDRTLWYTVIE